MKKSFKLGVIGAGFMSSAIVKGLVDSKYLNSNEIIVSDKNCESLDKIAKLGVKTSLSNIELPKVEAYIPPNNAIKINPSVFK